MGRLLVLGLVALTGCGGLSHRGPSSSAGTSVATQGCTQPEADPALVRDGWQEGAMAVGPLAIYPITDLARMPGDREPGPDVAPPVVLIPQGSKAVTLRVGRAARARFSLLFGGATTGKAETGFRVADGTSSVRLPACARGPVGFRGGFLYRPIPQCVPVTVRADGGPVVHATIAIGREPSSCPGWTTSRDRLHGVAVAYPRTWHRARATPTPRLLDPVHEVALATYPLRTAEPSRCAQVPEQALRDFGSRDVLITVQEAVNQDVDTRAFPRRKYPMVLGPANMSEFADCVKRHDIEEHWFPFSDRGRTFYGFVGFGHDVSAARRGEALRILDSLRFAGRAKTRRAATDLPDGWSLHAGQLAAAQDEVMVASSFPIPNGPPDANCAPSSALRAMPPDGAWLYVFDYGSSQHFDEGRPTGDWALRRPVRPYECMGRSRMVEWRESGHDLQAHLYLGRRAGPERRAELARVFDTLTVSR